MTCTRCHLNVPKGAEHCRSKTCNWCISCVRRKYEECGIPFKQMGQL